MINALYGHRGTYGEYLKLYGDSLLCEDGEPIKYKFWVDSLAEE